MVLKPLTNFLLRAQENTNSPKQDTKCNVYFYHLFLKVLHWTLEMRLWQALENLFAGNPMFPFYDQKFFYKYFCFQKNIWNWPSAHVGYGFENQALLFCWKSKLFPLKIQNWFFVKKKTNFSKVNFPNFFLTARWLEVWHTLMKNFARKTKKPLILHKW